MNYIIPVIIYSLLACNAYAFDTLSVKKYGAKADGKHDDTNAIQKTLNAAFSNGQGKTVYFPAGAYRITKPLNIPRNVNLLGDGVGFSSAIIQESHKGIILDGNETEGGWAFRNKIQGITLILSKAPKSSVGIYINSSYTIKLEDIFIYEAHQNGITITKSKHVNLSDVSIYGKSKKYGTGLQVTNSVINLYNIDIENFDVGLQIGPDTSKRSQTSIFGGFIERFGSIGMTIKDSGYNTFVGLNIIADHVDKQTILFDLDSQNKYKNTIIGGNISLVNDKSRSNISLPSSTEQILINVE